MDRGLNLLLNGSNNFCGMFAKESRSLTNRITSQRAHTHTITQFAAHEMIREIACVKQREGERGFGREKKRTIQPTGTEWKELIAKDIDSHEPLCMQGHMRIHASCHHRPVSFTLNSAPQESFQEIHF